MGKAKILLLAALALAVTASPFNRKLLGDLPEQPSEPEQALEQPQDEPLEEQPAPGTEQQEAAYGCGPHGNVCTKNGVDNGCLLANGAEYLCTTKRGKTEATKCSHGTVCDDAQMKCVPDKPKPDNVCTRNHQNRGCLESHGKQYVCEAKNGRVTATECTHGTVCNAELNQCVKPQPHQDNICERNQIYNGCLTRDGKQYACVDLGHGSISATECPSGSICDPSALVCKSVEPLGNNVCTQAGISNGCLNSSGIEYQCKFVKSGKTEAYKCPHGTVCDPRTVECVRKRR